jgi:hypothetical protein
MNPDLVVREPSCISFAEDTHFTYRSVCGHGRYLDSYSFQLDRVPACGSCNWVPLRAEVSYGMQMGRSCFNSRLQARLGVLPPRVHLPYRTPPTTRNVCCGTATVESGRAASGDTIASFHFEKAIPCLRSGHLRRSRGPVHQPQFPTEGSQLPVAAQARARAVGLANTRSSSM